MTVTQARLEDIYADSNDPWGFATSAYEQEKFRATRAALSRARYAAALEIGCGNGELARYLAPHCDSYTGLDAVAKAVAAARRAVPDATFVQGYVPQDLPERAFDLIVLSEILYFLSAAGIATLAAAIARTSPRAELICVTYLGDTGHELQGEDALGCLTMALSGTHVFEQLRKTQHYRIDRGLPQTRT